MNKKLFKIALINIDRFYNFKTIDVGIGEHNVNDINCPACYDEPEVCDCGGIVHSDTIDLSWSGLKIKRVCDKCGAEYYTD